MLPFFSMPAAFTNALRGRTCPLTRCWACQSSGPPLEAFNVLKDLRVLGLAYENCEWAIRLCRACAEGYKASFNAQLEKAGGDKTLLYRCQAVPKAKRAAKRKGGRRAH